MGIEVPSVRVLLEDGGQLYTITGIAPRIPRIGEAIVLQETKYRVTDIEHRIHGSFSPTCTVHVIVKLDA